MRAPDLVSLFYDMYLAEYLPRLQQISVSVEIPETHNVIVSLAIKGPYLLLKTAAKSTAGGPETCDEIQHRISLPVKLESALGGAKITKLACENAVISLTLSLDEPASVGTPTPFTQLSGSNGVWSVDDLLKKTPRDDNNVNRFQFTCARCDCVVVDSNLHKFADMPLEYWHEMMDFWHCHKPHEDHHDHHDKSYDGKLDPKPGFVHVGSSYILLPSQEEMCACDFQLGRMDGSTLRINKWDLRLRYADKTETYPPYSYVYFAILDRVNALGVRKFTVKSAKTAMAYNIWVTSVGLDVSLSDAENLSECLKLLYVVQEDDKDDDVIEVPAEVMDSLKEYFAKHTALLPKSHRLVEIAEGKIKRRYGVCYLSP